MDRVPAMGWADVVESTHPGVATGGRYYGWFPMARFVDLTVSATRDGFRDEGDHRQAHAPVYRNYVETTRDPTAKTAIGFAQCASRRGVTRVIGLTSPGNVDFVTSLGSSGPTAAASTWSDVFDGQVAPSVGAIVSLHD